MADCWPKSSQRGRHFHEHHDILRRDCGVAALEEGRPIMLLEDYFEFDEHSGAIRIKGHRVGLEHVVERFKQGYGPERIRQELDTLSLEDIYAAILYYLHNQAAVDTYIAELDRLFDDAWRTQLQHPSPLMLRMRAVREQWEQEGRFEREDQVPAR